MRLHQGPRPYGAPPKRAGWALVWTQGQTLLHVPDAKLQEVIP